jgi:TatD family-associated radical SAM protein
LQTLAYTINGARYLNITDRCTLRCRFCPKFRSGPQVHDYDLALEKRPTTEEIIAAIGDIEDYREIVFCGFGEPTLRLKPLLAIARYVKTRGGRVRVNTDGLGNLVHKRNILPELGECVDSLSVSMNADTEPLYNHHCRPALPGSYAAMLDFLGQAPHHVETVTASAIDGLEGVNIEACRQLAAARGVGFRRRILDDVG